MERIKPIGCRAFHYTRKVGKDNVCFYCGETIPSMLDKISEQEFLIQRLWMNINTKIAWAKETKIIRKHE